MVCIRTDWRNAAARCRIASVVDSGSYCDSAAFSGLCLHLVPPGAMPLSKLTRERIRRDHRAHLRMATFRCSSDATPALQARLLQRRKSLPVRVRTTPPDLLGGFDDFDGFGAGATASISTNTIRSALQTAKPGEWTLYAEDSGQPLEASDCPLYAVARPAPRADAWLLRAEWRAPDSSKCGLTRAKRKRAEALARLADPSAGGYEAERRTAARLLLREQAGATETGVRGSS